MSIIKFINITSNSGLISFGNTGARLRDPRSKYFKMLSALKDFRINNIGWNIDDQVEFGNLMGLLEIFDINKDNIVSSDKDVRVKTGFISQFGFATEQRIITQVGEKLINSSDNLELNEFEISNESFIYLKQFLKYQQSEFKVIPLLSLIYSVIEFNNELPIDFITYIWSGTQSKDELKINITNYKKYKSYKNLIYNNLLNTKNTENVIKNINSFFSQHTILDSTILASSIFYNLMYSILPHGKGNNYKNKSIDLFKDLYFYWKSKNIFSDNQKVEYIKEKLIYRYKDISSMKQNDYIEFLFGVKSFKKNYEWKNIILFLDKTDLIQSLDEKDFILNFHLFYMYIKKLSVCEEYKDLNIRHLKMLDIFIFDNDVIKLDIIFLYLFKSVKDKLLNIKILNNYEYSTKLITEQSKLGDIYDFLDIDYISLTQKIEYDYPEIKEIGLKKFATKKKEERLIYLIENVLTREKIIEIFENIYPRNDKKVREIIKNCYQEYEASIPALFEYLLAISFYFIAQKKIKISYILDARLDSNLLPISHTIGGRADIIVKGNKKDYLIEATLSENDGQRQMEAEPVPRHLAKYIIESNPNSLALFIAGKLDPNNLVVLRNYKFSAWYNTSGEYVENMDILPLSIYNVVFLLKHEFDFDIIEKKFDNLLNSENRDGFKWYMNEINPKFS